SSVRQNAAGSHAWSRRLFFGAAGQRTWRRPLLQPRSGEHLAEDGGKALPGECAALGPPALGKGGRIGDAGRPDVEFEAKMGKDVDDLAVPGPVGVCRKDGC